MKSEFIPFFNYIENFIHITGQEKIEFEQHLSIVNCNKYAVMPTTPEDKLFFVVEGGLHRYFYYNNQQTIIDVIGINKLVCPSESYFLGRNTDTVLETIRSNTGIITIAKENFENLLNKYLNIRTFWNLQIGVWFMEKQQREIEFIKYDSKQRIENFIKNNKQLYGIMFNRQLANYLRITPETFCRLKNELLKIK